MLIPHHQNARQNHNINMFNRSFENATAFRYLGMTVADQNLIHDEIKSRLNLGNLRTIQFRTFCLLVCCLKNIKIKMYKTIILPVVLNGCEIWSSKLREEHELKASEKMVLRRILEL
jgi:hypothetical protein